MIRFLSGFCLGIVFTVIIWLSSPEGPLARRLYTAVPPGGEEKTIHLIYNPDLPYPFQRISNHLGTFLIFKDRQEYELMFKEHP